MSKLIVKVLSVLLFTIICANQWIIKESNYIKKKLYYVLLLYLFLEHQFSFFNSFNHLVIHLQISLSYYINLWNLFFFVINIYIILKYTHNLYFKIISKSILKQSYSHDFNFKVKFIWNTIKNKTKNFHSSLSIFVLSFSLNPLQKINQLIILCYFFKYICHLVINYVSRIFQRFPSFYEGKYAE